MFWKDQTWNHIIGLYIAPTGQIDRPLDKKTNGRTDGWAEAQTDRQKDRWIVGETDILIHTHTHTHITDRDRHIYISLFPSC